MRFWDSSAIIPLLVRDERTERAQALWRQDSSPAAIDEASRRLDALTDSWLEIQPGERLRQQARRLLRVHPLQAADALQLAAALVAAEDQPRTLDLVTFDDRLADAARREGFPVPGRAA